MTREQLEHLIRAAATVADDDQIVVVGSQAILGQYPDAPEELRRSMEADVYPRNHPERWELIDGTIGELSPFHESFGYFAQGVECETWCRCPLQGAPRNVPAGGPRTSERRARLGPLNLPVTITS